MLTKIKLLLGISDTSKDALLQVLIDNETETATSYTHNTAAACEQVIMQMVVYRYNRIGTEGLTSESFSGASYNYESDYPASIMAALKSKRKVIWK